MKTVAIIGMGMSPADLTEAQLRLIRQADVLVGGNRHLAYFNDVEAEKKEIAGNLSELPGFISDRMDSASVVVLASGDPLYYGIGAYLARHLPRQRLAVYPNVTAVAAAFARIKTPWQNARVVTCHGRGALSKVMAALCGNRPVAVYTDPEHHPGWLGRKVAERGVSGWRMCVAEQLGSARERVRWFDPAEAAGERFSEPNLVVFSPMDESPSPPLRTFGNPDHAFAHEKGLITKAEVRAVVLSKLRPAPGSVLWDLGAGSGAVGIEAGAFVREGEIYAVERSDSRVEAIRQNRARFAVHNLQVIQAELPEALDGLPSPDRVFIGGGGKKLAAIIEAAAARLLAGGILVVNTVLLANVHTAAETLETLGFETETVQVQVSTGREMPFSQRLEAQNPVWIITGVKPENAEGRP